MKTATCTNGRQKWINCFNEVTAIIFEVDISSFDVNNEKCVNNLKESLQQFRRIWFNKWLHRVSIILFLNNYEIFANKILYGDSKLEKHFPEYKNFKPSNGLNHHYKVKNEHVEVTQAKLFILEMFINITKESYLNAVNELRIYYNETDEKSLKLINHDIYYNISRKYWNQPCFSKKVCIPYFTSTIAEDNLKKLLKACNSILQKEHLERTGLI